MSPLPIDTQSYQTVAHVEGTYVCISIYYYTSLSCYLQGKNSSRLNLRSLFAVIYILLVQFITFGT